VIVALESAQQVAQTHEPVPLGEDALHVAEQLLARLRAAR